MYNGPISFEEFIGSFTANRCLESSKTAQDIYSYLCSEPVRIKMTFYSENGLTALSACAADIESMCAQSSSDLDLSTKVARQTIGRMVAAALEPLGYLPYKRGRVNTGKKSVFSSAKVYRKEVRGTQIIISKIVDLPVKD